MPQAVRWCTVDEVAAHLKVSANTVRARFASGEWPAHKIPGSHQWRADLSEIDACLKSGHAWGPLDCPACGHRFTGYWYSGTHDLDGVPTAVQRCPGCGHEFTARWVGFAIDPEVVVVPADTPRTACNQGVTTGSVPSHQAAEQGIGDNSARRAAS